MPVKAERYAFKLVRGEIEAGTSLRASANLRGYLEWAEANAEEEIHIFGQSLFPAHETLGALKVAIRAQDTALLGAATLASFKP